MFLTMIFVYFTQLKQKSENQKNKSGIFSSPKNIPPLLFLFYFFLIATFYTDFIKLI